MDRKQFLSYSLSIVLVFCVIFVIVFSEGLQFEYLLSTLAMTKFLDFQTVGQHSYKVKKLLVIYNGGQCKEFVKNMSDICENRKITVFLTKK